MRRTTALLLGASLVGGAFAGCRTSDPDAFPRDGYVDPHGDDDDDSTEVDPNDPEGGDRIAFLDVIQHSTFGGGVVTYEARASFFDPEPLPVPQPGVEECFANGTDLDPWNPAPSSEEFGAPVITLDGDPWELEMFGTDYWRRSLPERIWTDGDDANVLLPETELGPVQYDDVVSLPAALVGTSMTLEREVGIVVEWESDVDANQLLLVVKGDDSGRTEYVVCAPLDDGEFVIPASLFDNYPAGSVELLLRRERVNDRWVIGPQGWGRTVGVSQVRAQFLIEEGAFDPEGDDDDSAGDDDDSAGDDDDSSN
ncbi:MAG: hypothetical protein KDA24_00375 [Deltaproteobacteria bacterium]|nr:hypothetical protein [Deltaproteobacteria bacterium]